MKDIFLIVKKLRIIQANQKYYAIIIFYLIKMLKNFK